MNKGVVKKKVISKKGPDALHLKLAYSLGRTVKKVSKTVAAVKKKTGRKKSRYTLITEDPGDPASPILKEIKAIADISGLTAALQEMNEISLENSNHPIISRVASKIQQLSIQEQELLSRKFIDRLRRNSYFINSASSFPAGAKMTQEDCQKISDAFIESILYALDEIGITPREKEFLQRFSNDLTRPINELVQFYLHPKTFSQKMKRLWRMQRIFIKMIKLVSMTKNFDNVPPGAYSASTPNTNFLLLKN